MLQVEDIEADNALERWVRYALVGGEGVSRGTGVPEAA
jgi:hypothetical protein